MLAIGLGLATLGGASAVYAMAQTDTSAELRATGLVGEQFDGYLGIVGGSAPSTLRAQVNGVNIKRRAFYTDLAARRGVKIEEAAAATACEIFATRIQPGQYYQLPDRVWRRRDGATPVPRPGYCG